VIALYRTICFSQPGDATAQHAATAAAGLVETGADRGWRNFKPGPGRPNIHVSLKLTDKRVECQVFAVTRGDETAVGAAAAFQEALSLEDLYLTTINYDSVMAGLNLNRNGHKLEVGFTAAKRKRFPLIELRTEWHTKGN
jgi:hypothetical protein